MSAGAPPPSPGSLIPITMHRAFVTGRFFLLYGMAISVLLAASLGFSGGSAFTSAFPLVLPIFGAVGSLGALTVFSSDRVKGVLEYLLAYGISPRRIFVNTIVVTLALVTMVLAVALGVGLGIFLGTGHVLSSDLALALGAYGVPMSYASAAFAATVGMYWTSLSSPRSGMNSPIGLAPLFGILPPVATLMIVGTFAAGGASISGLDLVALLAVVVTGAVVLALVALIGRLMSQERLLSPA